MDLDKNYDKSFSNLIRHSTTLRFYLKDDIGFISREDVDLDWPDEPGFSWFDTLEEAAKVKDKYEKDHLLFGVVVRLGILARDEKSLFWKIYEEGGKWHATLA